MSKAKLRTQKAKEEKVEEVKVAEEKEDKKSAKEKEEKVENVDVIDNAIKKASEAKESDEVEVQTEAKAEPNVRICPNQDIRTYIGDQWYNLKEGKQVSVPKTVKDKLRQAGYLDPL